ncbi:ExbD/TolR family protein [Mucilaginibacter ximonensis]|uniref:ExbD/TolR family protein n=1 Tax=Mucilaginibacter ximonensis TaxID=538021 RepID=A0ABW5YCR0_9SPHI
MAELDAKPAAAEKGTRTKTNKKSIRVDLTAMVDLAFLLITFFILTTTLQKPKTMDLVMPDKEGDHTMPVPESRTMTVLIGAKDKLEWFMGSPAKPLSTPVVDGFGKDGIRKALLAQSERVKQASNGEDMIVLIKAGAHSNYANIVGIMDELNIANIQKRALVDITPDEVNLLKRDHIEE